jgi:hypothetical protein
VNEDAGQEYKKENSAADAKIVPCDLNVNAVHNSKGTSEGWSRKDQDTGCPLRAKIWSAAKDSMIMKMILIADTVTDSGAG